MMFKMLTPAFVVIFPAYASRSLVSSPENADIFQASMIVYENEVIQPQRESDKTTCWR
jgi:hypothetical protein